VIQDVQGPPTLAESEVSMHTEVFGVFGDRAALERFRSPRAFDEIVTGESVTVGVRAPHLAVHGRADSHASADGVCALFGEVVPTHDGDRTTAAWFLDRYASEGPTAFSALNGSYLAVVDDGDEALVATDPVRSWEGYYADVDGLRVFGSDLSQLQGLLGDPGVDRTAVLEMLHLGTVLGDETLFQPIRRIPFDGYLGPDGTGSFERFVYEPREFDYVDELAARLQRAIERRSHYTGRKGLLLSAGKDSRIFLSQLPDIEHTYTVGRRDSREVRVAAAIAAQYDATHTAFEPGECHLYPADDKVLYSQGIKETLHIHHAGYDDHFDVDVMYHGLLFDTLFKGYFLEWDGLSVLGGKIESNTLVDDPDPIESLLSTLGYHPAASEHIADGTADVFADLDLDVDSPRAFLEDRLRAELERCWDRADSTHNAMDLLAIRNQPVLPFHTHLADNYLESFVAIDTELLAWHRHAPPDVRHGETFRRAINAVNPEILRHRPPNQPHTSRYLNEIERFLRRKLPVVEAFEPAWPDRRDVYDDYDLDERLFPEHQEVHGLPARQKLRVNDVRWWLS